MIIIGIDPGYERLGIAVLQKLKGETKETVLYSECFKTPSKIPFKERLFLLGKEFEKVSDTYKPEILSIENLFFQNNQKTAMNVAEVRGMILYQAIVRGMEIGEFTPLQIKSAVAGHGNADKRQVAEMVCKLVKIEKEIKYDDEYDAIAIALTAFATQQSRLHAQALRGK
jgi:crossover junction endodeoxyribonuclease RuvC